MPKVFTLSGGEGRESFRDDLNPEQSAVVRGADGYSLVLAGAGSGKTRTIIYRVARLLKSGVPAAEIMLLTFTNKAANEMLSRIERLMGAMPKVTGGTFHHVCNMILRRFAPAAGYGANFSILDQEDSRDLLNACIKDSGIAVSGSEAKRGRFPSASVLQSFWSFSRNARLPFSQVVEEKQPRLLDAVPRMEEVINAYEARKKSANAMDFDDLLVKATHLLRVDAAVRDAVAGRYRYVLVDEYQDTNRVQAEFLALVSSVHRNLLVVGDDAQSIYSFRAADVRNILGFPNAFDGASIFKLETNYRSTEYILELANESIRWNENQFPKKLHSARGVKPGDEKPSLVAASGADEEAEFVAEMILKLRDEGLSLSEIAVLFRATFHSQALEFELTKRGIPYDYRGGVRFFERSHIKDALSFLRIFVNPADEVSWRRVLRIQSGIGEETAAKIFAAARGSENLEEAMEAGGAVVGERARAGWKDFLSTARSVAHAGDSPSECIRAVIKSPYADYLDNEFPNAEERREDLEQLAVFAERYFSVSAFLAESALEEGFSAERINAASGSLSARGKEDDEEGRVVLSTIHQAKGLEWEAVFVIHLFDGAFPNARALEEEGGIEEERRLFYVALTRARNKLFLSYPLMGAGQYGYLHERSQFIRELPDNVYEEIVLRRSDGAAPGQGRGGATVFKDDGDDIIELDGFGEPKPPSGGAPSAWRKKSFLGDY